MQLDEALDTARGFLHLSGKGPSKARILLFAIRSKLGLGNLQLSFSTAARQGHSRLHRSPLQPPEPSEGVLLMVHAPLPMGTPAATPAVRALTSYALLLAFGVCGRVADLAKVAKRELRSPLTLQPRAATSSTLTLFPSHQHATSRTPQ